MSKQGLQRIEPEQRSLIPHEPQQAAGITPAQAKVDAVASLTMAAYQRASQLNLTDEEIAGLTADFPDEAFRPGAAGKDNLIYIEHAFLRDRLNSVFRPGQWAIVPRNRWAEDFTTRKNEPAVRVYVEAMLCIRGCFAAEAVGEMEYYPNNASQNYGDAVEGAKTAALRRCCKELGIGLQAWKKDWCEGWWQRRNGRGRPAPAARPAQAPAQPSPAPAKAPQTRPAAKQSDLIPESKGETKPTEKTKQWMIQYLMTLGEDRVLHFCQETGLLMPNETLKDFPLHRVPTTKQALNALMDQITKFEAPMPDEPDESGSKEQSDEDLSWQSVVVPVPRKGEKRVDYMKDPDTIGSLYYRMKGGDEDAGKRLFGFAHHYQPEGWTKQDGTKMPPNKEDIEFRAGLDLFLTQHGRKD